VKRRALTVLAGAALAWPLVADSLPAAQSPAADWSGPKRLQAGGLTVSYPRAWRASVAETTIIVESRDTRIMLIDYGPMEEDDFPVRPDRFTLSDGDRHFLSCNGFEGWNVIFTDRGQVVQAFVKLGPATRKSDAAEVLDRLEVVDRLVG
jgi:hypothetical protein